MNVLTRRLGLTDSIVVGLGSMIGAGVFVAFGPAADAAGYFLIVSLLIAAAVAWCNATSTARLATVYPASGGTYVYGRERLGPLWGYLAGWGFIVGKIASCAAMALAVGYYVWPAHPHVAAVSTVLLVTVVNALGVGKSAAVSKVIVVFVIAVLVTVAVFALTRSPIDFTPVTTDVPAGILEGAALLFFAFAGYARIATLGEDVRDPARTIGRAINSSLLITVVLYALVAVALLYALGPGRLAFTDDPITALAADAPALELAVRGAAVLAAAGALLALILGISRTTLAMARDGHLPQPLARISRRGAPVTAEFTVGLIVAVLAATLDLRDAIGFSSFAVLFYYLIANVAASTLTRAENRPPRVIPIAGAIACVALAFSLATPVVLTGVAVLAAGAISYIATRASQPR